LFKLKNFVLILSVSLALPGCLSTSYNKPNCTIIKQGPTICDKPKSSKFMNDFIDATESHNKTLIVRKSNMLKKDKSIKKVDVGVGFFTALFKMFFGSDDE